MKKKGSHGCFNEEWGSLHGSKSNRQDQCAFGWATNQGPIGSRPIVVCSYFWHGNPREVKARVNSNVDVQDELTSEKTGLDPFSTDLVKLFRRVLLS